MGINLLLVVSIFQKALHVSLDNNDAFITGKIDGLVLYLKLKKNNIIEDIFEFSDRGRKRGRKTEGDSER